MAFKHNGTAVITNDRLVRLNSGADGSRPASPTTGTLFYNTTSGAIEVYNGLEWKVSRTLPAAGTPALYAWGENPTFGGKLGDNSTVSRSSPVTVVGGVTDWISVSAGENHSLALKANGSAWSWGSGLVGALGNGISGGYRSSPVSVIGYSDWVQISAGDQSSFAIRANGSGWAWGLNNNGQLGTNYSNTANSPISIVGNFTWRQIDGGGTHTIGVRNDGTAWSWGSNNVGQLGADLGTDNRSSPVSVVGGFADWVQVSAGFQNSGGVRANGTLWTWGANFEGQLGNNDSGINGYRSSPVSVLGGFTDWIFISFRGRRHAAGLRANGTLWTWGENNLGVLGTNISGAGTSRSSPVSVVGGFTDWAIVTSGYRINLAIRTNGTLWAWGDNGKGQLGVGDPYERSSPTSVVGGFTDWVSVATEEHTLAIRAQPRNQHNRF